MGVPSQIAENGTPKHTPTRFRSGVQMGNKLTDRMIKNYKPKDKAYKVFDGQGLFLQIKPNGSKLWRLKYRFKEKEKRNPVFSIAKN